MQFEDQDAIAEEVRAQERRSVLKRLQLCLRALLASSEGNQDVVFDNSIHLDRFCLAFESVLRYGFKESKKKRLFGGNRDYWSYVCELEKFLPHSRACIENVRNLTNVRTEEGKGRAWIMCSLVEKALETYIASLTKRVQLTREWYSPHAILLQPDELRMLFSLLAPLSVVEFSLCLKDIDFDNLPTNMGNAEDIIQSISTTQKLNEKEEKIKELESSLRNNSTGNVSELEESHKEERERLTRDMSQLATTIRELQRELQQANENAQKKQETYRETLKQKQQQHEITVANLQAQINLHEEKYTLTEVTLLQTQQQLSEATTWITEHRDQLLEQQQQQPDHSLLQSKINSLQSENESLHSQLQALLNSDNNQSNPQVFSNELQEKMDELQQLLLQEQTKSKELQEKLDASSAIISENQTKLTELTQFAKQQQETNETLAEQRAAQEQKYNEQISLLESQIAQLESSNEQLLGETERIQRDNQTKVAQHETMYQSLQADSTRSQQLNQQLQQELEAIKLQQQRQQQQESTPTESTEAKVPYEKLQEKILEQGETLEQQSRELDMLRMALEESAKQLEEQKQTSATQNESKTIQKLKAQLKEQEIECKQHLTKMREQTKQITTQSEQITKFEQTITQLRVENRAKSAEQEELSSEVTALTGKIGLYKQRLQENAGLIESYSADLLLLNDQLRETNTTRQSLIELQGAHTQLQERVSELKQLVASKNESIEKLKEQNEALKQQLSVTGSEMEDLRALATTKGGQLEQFQTVVQQHAQLKADYQKLYESDQTRQQEMQQQKQLFKINQELTQNTKNLLQSKIGELKQLEDAHHQLTDELAAKEVEIQKQAETIQSLKKSVHEFKNATQLLQSEVEKGSKERIQLQQALDDSIASLHNVQSQLSGSQLVASERQREIESLKEQLAESLKKTVTFGELQQLTFEQSKKISELQDTLDNTNETLQSLQSVEAKYDHLLQEKQTELDSVTTERDQLVISAKEVAESLETTKQQLAQTQHSLQQANKQLEKYKSKFSELSSIVDLSTKQMEEQEQQIVQLTAQRDLFKSVYYDQTRLYKLQTDQPVIQQALQEAKNSMNSGKSSVEKLAQNITQMKQQLEDPTISQEVKACLRPTLAVVVNELKMKRDEVLALVPKVNEMQQNLRSMEEEITSLQSKLDASRSSLTD